jgi:hypothetical protein
MSNWGGNRVEPWFPMGNRLGVFDFFYTAKRSFGRVRRQTRCDTGH